MAKRRTVTTDIETEVLTRSGRRCCICFGLRKDTNVKKGQIAHLDHDHSNSTFDNLAFLCLDHHDEYDSTTRQSKGLTMQEVKRYRDALYQEVTEMVSASWFVEASIPSEEVPLLRTCRVIEPKPGIPFRGIQVTDMDMEGEKAPLLSLRLYFKRSKYFAPFPIDQDEKWLYVEANMRPALSLRVQVRAWNKRDVAEFMRFLHSGGHGYDLHGPRPGNDELSEDPTSRETHAGDYLRVWQDDDEYRVMLSTFTATNAGISVHARLAKSAATEIASYLETAGFAS